MDEKVKELGDCLVTCSDYLTKLGLPFTLFGGVLLGIIRDGTILPHDKDVDVAVLAEDLTPEIVEAIKGSPLFRAHNNGETEYGHFTLKENKISFDIFVLYKKDNIRYMNPTGSSCLVFLAECYEGPLGEITYLDRRWKIPYKHVDYFKAMYGDGWKITEKSSNWHNAPCFKKWKDL